MGRHCLPTSRSGKSNLWSIQTDGGGPAADRLKSNVTSFQWSPNGEQIVFTAADAPSAEEERSTRQGRCPRRRLENQTAAIVCHSARSPSGNAVPRLTDGERNVVGERDRPGRPAFSWSPDNRTIVFSHTVSSPDEWGLLICRSWTSDRMVAGWQTAAAESSPLFSPDGKRVACGQRFATDLGRPGGFTWFRLREIQREHWSRQPTILTIFELLGWSLDGSGCTSPAGGTVLWIMKVAGRVARSSARCPACRWEVFS
jgi:hypothetical protein